MTDDADLLQRYADTGSESAFTELVERYIDLVHTAALRRLGGDSHRAADVTQQVFIALARHAQTLSRRPVLVGWLYTTTRHAVLDHLRAEQRRLVREHSAHELHAMSDPGVIADEWKELRPLLDLAMDELGESEREVILLRFFEENSFVEIGAKLSIAEDTARMRTHRALEKLHGLLKRRGIASTAAALGATLAAQSSVAAPAGLAAAVSSGAILAIASTGTTALTTGILTLMSTTKPLLAIAGILTAAAIGSAIYEARLAQNANLAVADLQRERDTLRTQTTALETRLNETSASLAHLTTAQAKPSEISTAKVPLESKTTATSQDRMWINPDYGRLYVQKFRSSLGLTFGSLYRELKLSPEQIEKFEATVVERTQSIADLWSESVARGLSPRDPSVTRLTTESWEIENKALVTLLGEAGVARYRQYEKEKDTRDLVTSLAGNLSLTETPLSAAQGDQLVRVVKANTQTKKVPMKDEGAKTVYTLFQETDWAAANSQAQSLLSPAQLTAFKNIGEQRRLQNELTRLATEAMKQP